MIGVIRTVEKFFSNIEDYSSTYICWIWKGRKDNRTGDYGRFSGCKLDTVAHKWIWVYLFGPVPYGYLLHHTCKNQVCVNPVHLECITRSDHQSFHIGLKTVCKNGHEMTEENTYTWLNQRLCRTCRYNAVRRSYELRRI